MEGLMRVPIVLAVLVVAGRVAAERAGAPAAVSALISAVGLHLLIGPVYFAFRIGGSSVVRPYLTLVKSIGIYAVLVRAMVVPTYWLAYIFQWPEPRFSVENAGVVGPDVTPIQAYVLVPLVLTVSWVLGSLIIGTAIGSLVLAIRRRLRAP